MDTRARVRRPVRCEPVGVLAGQQPRRRAGAVFLPRRLRRAPRRGADGRRRRTAYTVDLRLDSTSGWPSEGSRCRQVCRLLCRRRWRAAMSATSVTSSRRPTARTRRTNRHCPTRSGWRRRGSWWSTIATPGPGCASWPRAGEAARWVDDAVARLRAGSSWACRPFGAVRRCGSRTLAGPPACALPRRHRGLPGDAQVGGELRDLPHEHRRPAVRRRPVRDLPPVAPAQPGAVRGLPQARRRPRAVRLARAVPHGRRGRSCRVASDQGHGTPGERARGGRDARARNS